MRITSNLFAAHLKCPTKCWLRSRGEPDAGNLYADWVRTQTESYRRDSAERLLECVPENERVVILPVAEKPVPAFAGAQSGRDGSPSRPLLPPTPLCPVSASNPKTAKWRLATDLLAQTQDLESCLHAVERVPSEGRGKPAQFIPIRFGFTNKLTKDDKLLVSFDALVLNALAMGQIRGTPPKKREQFLHFYADSFSCNQRFSSVSGETPCLRARFWRADIKSSARATKLTRSSGRYSICTMRDGTSATLCLSQNADASAMRMFAGIVGVLPFILSRPIL